MVLNTDTVIVGAVPAMCMLLMTIIGLKIKVSDNISGALQHFAAGLLLSAVGSELLPTLLNATGFQENLYATIGFFAGMGVLISERAKSLRQSAKAINAEYCDNCETIKEAGHSHGGGEVQPLIVSSSSSSKQKEAAAIVEKALPMSFLAAIIVDACMDGFLIGIAGAAGPSATIIMAGSLSVEMSFVGLTLATACHGMPYSKSIPAALAGPLFLIMGSLLGDVLANQVADDPSMLAAIMGFGTSALLFMVAEELLLEAHEDGEHTWWVDVQLYTGFYWGFMATKFTPE
ncbi:hypothetical protein FRACYDRAFT_244169 [Fragilariopsis cylindrus CCMP1102]|uniref:Uncharacterized protein n=1 Tax=Fragilariopsis cylindrus CCMP1102 TaxID=635003 RepID=A0A1E7F438_9STRA|nr:hypothetical protein FRACYDRAFT_244169 [Fragilariopsis cylindrus CCMP1102]|eukprot:OEU12896.1 hypothetical protein FRACYDRAFT_244169 [Fragilariopsis cylindrus CCMP1102]